MKVFLITSLYLVLSVGTLLHLTSCATDESLHKKIPQTQFIAHHQLNESHNKPFVDYWEDTRETDPNAEQPADQKATPRKPTIYIAPTNLSYLVKNHSTEAHKKQIEGLGAYFDQSLKKAFAAEQKKHDTFELADRKTKNCYVVEVAIISAVPTKILNNVLKQAVGSLKHMAAAPLAASQIEEKGNIVMAAKLTAPNGHTLVELEDIGQDQSSLLGVDLKDFSSFSHHRRRIEEWSKQLAETFTTPRTTKVKKANRIPINPF